jgi:asparagine synthase (glutamine-hydrolysing)
MRRNLTYLSALKLSNLERSVATIDAEGVPGAILEAGVALGGSAAVLATGSPGREFHGYDVFATIPAPGERDGSDVHRRYEVIASGRSRGIRGDLYYGYRDDLLTEVTDNLRSFGLEVGGRVQLHKGLFEDTLHPDGPIALVHVDCDWYDPVRLVLERVYPQLTAVHEEKHLILRRDETP